MMRITLDFLYIHKENGEIITASEIEQLALKAYQRFNDLLPVDVESVTTGVFEGTNKPLNYCGMFYLHGGYNYQSLKNKLLSDIIEMNKIIQLGG